MQFRLPTVMRIVAGKHAGRDLASPQDRRVRPTAEHVRAAMLDMVSEDLKDARVLELFAGTGRHRHRGHLQRAPRARTSSSFAPTASMRCARTSPRSGCATRRGSSSATRFPMPRCSAQRATTSPSRIRRTARASSIAIIGSWKTSHFSRVLVVEHAVTHELPRGASAHTYRRDDGDGLPRLSFRGHRRAQRGCRARSRSVRRR